MWLTFFLITFVSRNIHLQVVGVLILIHVVSIVNLLCTSLPTIHLKEETVWNYFSHSNSIGTDIIRCTFHMEAQ